VFIVALPVMLVRFLTKLLTNSSHVVSSALLASLLDAMHPLAPDAQEDNFRMMQDKDHAKPVPLVGGQEMKAPNPLLIVFLFVVMVLTVLPALSLVLSVLGIVLHWNHHKMDSRHVKTVPRVCLHSSPVQMTLLNVAKNVLLVTTATLG